MLHAPPYQHLVAGSAGALYGLAATLMRVRLSKGKEELAVTKGKKE